MWDTKISKWNDDLLIKNTEERRKVISEIESLLFGCDNNALPLESPQNTLSLLEICFKVLDLNNNSNHVMIISTLGIISHLVKSDTFKAPCSDFIWSNLVATRLLSILEKCTNLQIQAKCSHCLSICLDQSKQYLVCAQKSPSKMSSFTSFSQSLGSTIFDIISIYIDLIGKDNAASTISLTNHYKNFVVLEQALNILALNCSFDKLEGRLADRLYEAFVGHIFHNDERIQICSWTFLSQLFSNGSVNRDLMLEPVASKDCLLDVALSRWKPDDKCFLEISNFMIQACSSPINILERWEKKICEILRSFSFAFNSTTCNTANVSIVESSHRLRYLKFIERLTKTLQCKVDLDLSEWWLSVIKDFLDPFLRQNEDGTIRCITCDIFSNLPNEIFKQFPRDVQTYIITMMLGLTEDALHSVRAAAVRALGAFVLLECVQEDYFFLTDLSFILVSKLRDPNINVQIKSSWVLGNLADALARQKMNFNANSNLLKEEEKKEKDALTIDDDNRTTWFDTKMNVIDEIVAKILSAAVDFDFDERCMSNILRCVGSSIYVIRLSSNKHVDDKKIINLIVNGIALIEDYLGIGSHKIRWNAAHAASNILSNKSIIENAHFAASIKSLSESLLKAFDSCKNFKVKINSLAAILLLPPQPLCSDFRNRLLLALHSRQSEFDSKLEEIHGLDVVEFKYLSTLRSKIEEALFLMKSTSSSGK